MVRKIIEINEELCTGCGDCIPNCHEGALQIIDGKARVVSDLMCDGLGACVGHCPTGAMEVVERDAEPYDESKVMLENIIPAGENTILAHLHHLKEHNETEYLRIAVETLEQQGVENPMEKNVGETAGPGHHEHGGGCPGSRIMQFVDNAVNENIPQTRHGSALRQWPVQLHLVSPGAPYFRGADVILAADCTAYAVGDFHGKYLAGKSLAVACPKLDSNLDTYVQKIISLIDDAGVNTLSVIIMEVPCCSGLLTITQEAVGRAKRKVPLKKIVISVQGNEISDEWV